MSDDVIQFNGLTTLPLSPKTIIESLDPDKYEDILVLGWDKDGELAVNGSRSENAEILYLIEYFKNKLLNGEFEE